MIEKESDNKIYLVIYNVNIKDRKIIVMKNNKQSEIEIQKWTCQYYKNCKKAIAIEWDVYSDGYIIININYIKRKYWIPKSIN